MRTNKVLTLAEAQQRTPAVSAVEAMRQQLQLALFDAVRERDVTDMATKLKEMALQGDLRAMKLFFQLVMGNQGTLTSPQQPQVVQQVAVMQPANETPSPVMLSPAPRPPLPVLPTSHAPGSDEKIEVMAQRVQNGEAIFHPGDAGHGRED